MKINKKGYMLVEIIVSFVLAFSIAMYLLNLTIKSLIVNDSMTLEDKVAKIVKASKDYIAEVESWKEEYSFDGIDEIQKYHFSKDEIAKQAYYSEHKYDIFNSIYERKCNITEIVECILRKLQDTIMSIYNEYVNNGNVLYEYEMPQSETALNYINNQKYYRERVSSKVNACVLAIHKLYNEMVKYQKKIIRKKKNHLYRLKILVFMKGLVKWN